MAGLALFRTSAVKVLGRAYTFIIVLVGDEELRNVAVSTGGIGVVFHVNVSSWTTVQTKSLESVDAFGAVLALGLEFGLGLEESYVQEIFFREGLSRVNV